MSIYGRPRKIQGENCTVLAAFVESDPTATLDELRAELKRRTGIDAHEQTGDQAGSQSRGGHCRAVRNAAARYGYSGAHRR